MGRRWSRKCTASLHRTSSNQCVCKFWLPQEREKVWHWRLLTWWKYKDLMNLHGLMMFDGSIWVWAKATDLYDGRHLSKMMVLQWWWWWWWWWWDALWAKLWLKTLPAMSVPDIFSEAELHTLCRSHAGLTTLLLRLAVDKYKTWFTKPFRPAAVYGKWPLLTWGGHHGILRACTSRRY